MKKTLIIIALMAAMLFTAASAFAFKAKEVIAFDIDPNPMEDFCNIHTVIPSPAYMYLRVETLEGEVVSDIFNGYASKEMYFTWERYSDSGEYLPSGNYLVVLSLDQRYTSTKKTLILK